MSRTKHPNKDFLGLFESGNGRWEIDHRVMRGGPRYRVKLHTMNREVAERLFVEFCLDPEGFMATWESRRRLSESPKFSACLAAALDEMAQKRVSKGRRDRVRGRSRRFVRLVGDRPMRSYSIEDLLVFREDMAHLNPATVNAAVRMISRVFSFAKQKGWVIENPVAELENLPELGRTRDVPRIVSKEEILQLELSPFETNYLVALWATGLRTATLLRVTPAHFRFWEGRAFLDLNARVVKTGRGRKVPFEDASDVAAAMAFVIEHERLGRPTMVGTPGRIRARCSRLGMPHFTPGGLRHSRITMWVNAGVPAPQVAKWAGHSLRYLLENYYRGDPEQNPEAWPELKAGES